MKLPGRWGGGGVGRWVSSKHIPEDKAVTANRGWHSGNVEGSWPRRCLPPAPSESKGGSDAERRTAFDSAKGTSV